MKPQIVPGLTETESELWIALTVLSQLFTPAMDQRLRGVGLTLFEYGALMSLADAPGQTLRISAMAERTYAPLPRMSRVVAKLEARGLVGRVTSEQDARVVDVTLTGVGRRRLRDGAAVHGVAARELVLHRLADYETETLAALLARLARSLDPAGPLGG